MAIHLGINRVQLSYFETYKRSEVPGITILNKLSDLFCVDLSILIEEDLDLTRINASFAFRSSDMKDSDIETLSIFHELIKNYVKMQKLVHVN